MMDTPVANNTVPPPLNDLPSTFMDIMPEGFFDTGIIVKVGLPYTANTSRKTIGMSRRFADNVLPTNRQPFFGFRVDPFFSHDLSGPFSPLIYPNPIWGDNNVDLTAHCYGHEHPLVRQAPCFTGWTGSLEYLITINSSAIVQGELSIISGKYTGSGEYTNFYPELEYDEVTNNQIVSLTTERRIVKICGYSENTNFINTNLDSLFHTTTTNQKPINAFRNYIFIRPNTDISTMISGNSQLSFKIFMKPGPDFDWLYPSIPIRPDYFRDVSVVDKAFPFVILGRLIVQQRFVNATGQPLIINDDYAKTITNITLGSPRVTVAITNPYGGSGLAWFNPAEFTPEALPQWVGFTQYSYGLIAGSNNFSVDVSTNATPPVTATLFTLPIENLVWKQIPFRFGVNVGSLNSIQPPFWLE